MSNIKPPLPISARRLIRQFVEEDDAHSIKDIEGFQIRELLAEISYNKECFAYTCEFGCLDDLISDLLASQYNQSKAFNMIEELYIDTWIDEINKEMSDVRESNLNSARDLQNINPAMFRNMNDGFVVEYENKRGE